MIPKVVKQILIRLENNGYEAYLVGGFVRDFLFHRKTNDFDIATNALPKEVIKIIGSCQKKIKYGSYHLKIENYNIDITTYRKELTYEKRRPVQFMYTSNLILDAKRRDFTMNALYMNKNGEIIDPLESLKDIKLRQIKMIGNARERLREDPLRILRAVRFSCLYDLKIEKHLKKAIKLEKSHLLTLSKERIKKELDAILLANGFSLLKKLDLLKTLGIRNKKIVYIEDLGGLWAQLQLDVEYPLEKKLKMREKSIKKGLKCDTMNMLWLYKTGYYDSRIIWAIKGYPLKKLDRMYQSLLIYSRSDLLIDAKEIEEKFHITGRELGVLLEEIESKIVLKKLKNDKESIENYIMKR